MRSRDIIGRRIVGVHQERRRGNAGMEVEIIGLILDNGSRIVFHAQEAEAEPFVTTTLVKPTKEPK